MVLYRFTSSSLRARRFRLTELEDRLYIYVKNQQVERQHVKAVWAIQLGFYSDERMFAKWKPRSHVILSRSGMGGQKAYDVEIVGDFDMILESTGRINFGKYVGMDRKGFVLEEYYYST